MKCLGALTGLLALSACGSSGGSFHGTVAGYSLQPAEVVFVPVPQTREPAFTLVTLADRQGICNGFRTGVWGRNTTSLAIYLSSGRPSASPASVGAYYLVTQEPNSGAAYFLKLDEQCRAAPGLSDNSVPATSGLVLLNSIDASAGGRAKGSFDITFGTGDRITGTFDAKYCDLPSSRAPTCG